MMLNCDPNDPDAIHFHLVTCRCGGRGQFRPNMRRCYIILFGEGCPKCVLARWKNFEAAAAIMVRFIHMNGLGARALHLVYDNASLEQAEHDAQVAAQAGEVNHAANNMIRGKKLIKFLDKEVQDKTILSSAITNGPGQTYLNRLF